MIQKPLFEALRQATTPPSGDPKAAAAHDATSSEKPATGSIAAAQTPEIEALRTELATERQARERIESEIAANRRALHGAGRLDADALRDAALWRASQENSKKQVDPEIVAMLSKLAPKEREAFEHIIETKVAEKERAYQERFGRLEGAMTAREQRELAAQADQLKKAVPAGALTDDVIADLDQIRTLPRFAGRPLTELYEIVTGKKIEQKREAKSKPPPETANGAVTETTTEVKKPRFRRDQLGEAMAWAREHQGA